MRVYWHAATDIREYPWYAISFVRIDFNRRIQYWSFNRSRGAMGNRWSFDIKTREKYRSFRNGELEIGTASKISQLWREIFFIVTLASSFGKFEQFSDDSIYWRYFDFLLVCTRTRRKAWLSGMVFLWSIFYDRTVPWTISPFQRIRAFIF